MSLGPGFMPEKRLKRREILPAFFSLDIFCLIITYCHVICNTFSEKNLKMSLDKLQMLCYNCHAMSNKPVVSLDYNHTRGDKHLRNKQKRRLKGKDKVCILA